MKLQLSNRSDKQLTLIIEPNPDHYVIAPMDTVVVVGGLEHTADGTLLLDWYGDDLVLYDDCSSDNEVIVKKDGVLQEPWAHPA